ncbi:hypothetical protein Tco_0757225 [Tanacetum coccineum]
MTSNGTCPNGHDSSPEKPTRGVLESTRRDLIDGFKFRKQCLYITSHDLPLSKYALFTCLPDMCTLITTRSDEPSFWMGGNVISPIPLSLAVFVKMAVSCLVFEPIRPRQPWGKFRRSMVFALLVGSVVKLPPIRGFPVRVCERKPMGCPLTKLTGPMKETLDQYWSYVTALGRFEDRCYASAFVGPLVGTPRRVWRANMVVVVGIAKKPGGGVISLLLLMPEKLIGEDPIWASKGRPPSRRGGGQGFDLHSLQGQSSFSTFGKTESSLSTFSKGKAAYVLTSSIYHVKRDTSERPPSQDPYEVTAARWRSRVAARLSPPSSPTHDSPPTTCIGRESVDAICSISLKVKDVIENGNSFKPAAKTTTNADGTSTTLISGLYKDAKTLFAVIQTRFGDNEATKKTQKTLLKQMYKNFSAPSTESLDSIFNRLQKIISQLAILGENISQEDLNLKFLRSLPSEWKTHVVV